MIYKIRNYCTKTVLLSIYYSIFHSQLSYGLSIWGSSSDCYLSKIYLLQKKAIRAITFSDYYAHTAPLLKDLCILSLNDLFDYKTISLMWDFDHGMLPKSLAALFIRRNEVHKRNLCDRNKNNIYTAQRFNNKHTINFLIKARYF